MKKTLSALILLQFFVLQSFSQNAPEEYNSIQKFIESTVQIPFMARVADVQGAVRVRITMGIDSLPVKYEVTQSLRPDCDLEALRVVKLLNIKMLREVLNGKKKILIEVPFINPEKISYDKNFVIEYFNKEQKITNIENEIVFARRFSVDTTSGVLNSNVEYFDVKGKNINRIGFGLFRVDSSEKYSPTVLESSADTIKKFRVSVISNEKFPTMYFENFQNGQTASKRVENKFYVYYPNGRINSITETIDNGSLKGSNTAHWYANGQLAYFRKSEKVKAENLEKYIAVWDTLGKQIVIDGNGLDEYYEGNVKNLTVHSGLIKDGFKEGRWTGKNTNGNLEYVENYDKGKCVKGESYLGKNTYSYTNPDENAEFKGGMEGFANHLQRNLAYPNTAQKSNVEGKVYVQFVVCTDGTLCDYKVLKGVGYGCDEESIRVIQLSSGKWKPGKLRGRAVRSRFTIPINYQLSR